MEKEKLYELGKKGFEKELGYIPDIEKCKYYTVKDSCDEIVTKFIRDEYGNVVDDYQVEETFEWVVEERLKYVESNMDFTSKGKKEEIFATPVKVPYVANMSAVYASFPTFANSTYLIVISLSTP